MTNSEILRQMAVEQAEASARTRATAENRRKSGNLSAAQTYDHAADVYDQRYDVLRRAAHAFEVLAFVAVEAVPRAGTDMEDQLDRIRLRVASVTR